MEPLLQVRDLSVVYRPGRGSALAAVRGASFELRAGEVAGLLGESGSGKTTLALTLLQLLPRSAQVVAGSVRFRGRELLTLPEDGWQSVRGAEIGMIFQEPALALNPVLRVGEQVADVLAAHRSWPRRGCRQEAEAMLREVGFEEPQRIYGAYPHQLSGGERQRIVIAQALACRPALVVADEPTSSLDTTTQAEILALLRRLVRDFGTALLLISHDPAILGEMAQRILVMYGGRVVEDGGADEVYRSPLHPYTQGLLRSRPSAVAPAGATREKKLPCIPGSPPDPAELPPGCAFEPRCSDRMEICTTREPGAVQPDGAARCVRCFKYGG